MVTVKLLIDIDDTLLPDILDAAGEVRNFILVPATIVELIARIEQFVDSLLINHKVTAAAVAATVTIATDVKNKRDILTGQKGPGR